MMELIEKALRFARFFPSWGPFDWIFFIALIAAGRFFVMNGIKDLKKAGESVHDWSTTTGIVVRADITTRPGSTHNSFPYEVPSIVFRYKVADREYESDQVSFGNEPKGTAQEVVTRYAVGTRVKVHFDPGAPAEAVLEPGVKGVQYQFLIPGIMLLGSAALMLIFGIKSSIDRESRYAEISVNIGAQNSRTDSIMAEKASATRDVEGSRGVLETAKRVPEKAEPMGQREEKSPRLDPASQNAALMKALERGEWERALSFIDGGADVRITNASGATPLSIAVESNWLEGVRLLLEKGADVNATLPGKSETFLMVAVRRRSLDLAKLLIDRGADLDRRNTLGQTALLIAMERRDRAMIGTLVESGADVSIADASGQSAMDMVHGFRNDEEIRELLRKSKKKSP